MVRNGVVDMAARVRAAGGTAPNAETRRTAFAQKLMIAQEPDGEKTEDARGKIADDNSSCGKTYDPRDWRAR